MANLTTQQLAPEIIQALSFAEALAAMPNVGTDADFEHIHSDGTAMKSSSFRLLTTQEAATILNVSRPYLVKLIENGEIPFHKNGGRRKVLFKDLMEYKQKRDDASMVLLDELTAEAQAFDMGY